MNRTFIFNLPKDFKETMPLGEFILFATLRVASVIFYDGNESSDEEIEVEKITEIQDFISKAILSKGASIMEDDSFRIAFDIEDSLFI
jgi:hypothetical protein